ncbi:MAG: trigger factor family protein, partial [Proteobacteria bacterium]|nr:trigger factor family protein [Pseudomonadota bacterium]
METTFEKTGATTGRLEFSIDQETVQKGLDKTFKKVQKTLKI